MARLEARVDPEMKALWQQAAELQGCSLTDFVVSSVQEAACKAIEQYRTLNLSRQDSEAFVDALLNPPLPNEALTTAAARYRQAIQS